MKSCRHQSPIRTNHITQTTQTAIHDCYIINYFSIHTILLIFIMFFHHSCFTSTPSHEWTTLHLTDTYVLFYKHSCSNCHQCSCYHSCNPTDGVYCWPFSQNEWVDLFNHSIIRNEPHFSVAVQYSLASCFFVDVLQIFQRLNVTLNHPILQFLVFLLEHHPFGTLLHIKRLKN